MTLEIPELEQLKKDDVDTQHSVVIDNDKKKDSLTKGPTSGIIDSNGQEKLLEISCRCIKNQLPSQTMHAVLKLCATLTKVHSVAVSFLDAGALRAMLSLPIGSLFPGFNNVAATIIRHILEDPHTLQQAMELEIRHSLVTAIGRHGTARVTPRSFVQSLSFAILRDPVIFMQAVQAICQIEMVGDRPYIVLLKDREKEKRQDKDKSIEKDKQPAVHKKVTSGDVSTAAPGNGNVKVPDSNAKSAKIHRKSPHSFTCVIEHLLDTVVTYVPPLKVDDLVDDAPGNPPLADMDIDSTSAAKGKGKALDVSSEESRIAGQEASAFLAKTVFVLKLLTEIFLTYASSIHLLLRRDGEIKASATFIDVGLVRSLTRALQVLDLDHADSPKLVTGIIKALDLVTKEHVLSVDHNSAKGGNSAKVNSDQNQVDSSYNVGNRFQSLETTSQPDHNEVAGEHVESFDAGQNSVGSDSVADDMDHDQDLGVFAREAEDNFMHGTSGDGGCLDNGVSSVEIRFDIHQNDEEDVIRDEDDDDMSGDEGHEAEEDDEEEEENNDLEEDVVHQMLHPDTDQDDHDIDDEEFDEDIMEEEEEEDDDDDDDDGVILRLEEGINGNIFDHIEVFSGSNNFSNETLRVTPLDIFGSRRPGRTTSIYNLLGRSGEHGGNHEHPLLEEPSAFLDLVNQRQSENAVDMAFSDRHHESNSARLDAIFQTLRSGRHGHRFNTWLDDRHQRSGSSAASVPQGIEEILVSQLRRPTPIPEESTRQDAASAPRGENNDSSQLQGSESQVNEETPGEGNENNDNMVTPSPVTVVNGAGNVGEGPAGGDMHQEGHTSVREENIGMQYERSDAIIRDVEAVSRGSSGSGATLGENLCSLEVEIGRVDGHDDVERQGPTDRLPLGDLQGATRSRRSSGSTLPMGSRDVPLESVREVPPYPSGDANENAVLEDNQHNRSSGPDSIDPAFLEALPEDLRAEVLNSRQSQVAEPSSDQSQADGEIDPEFLAALPPDIREEVLAQQRAQRRTQSHELEGQPVEMDAVSIIATFPSEIREEVLLTSPDTLLSTLSPALVAEANMLRERFAHRYHSSTLFGIQSRNRRVESSRRGDMFGSSLGRNAADAASRKSAAGKVIETDDAPLVETDDLKALFRILCVVQPLYKGQYQRLLLSLCAHNKTRTSLVQILLGKLMLDLWGSCKSKVNVFESPHRLYGCQSYITYSRPQFSDGVPPLLSRRILETLTYLARNHEYVAKLLLNIEIPRLVLCDLEMSNQGRGKALIMEEDEPEDKKGDFSIVLLISLLNQPLYMRSVAHLEQLLNLLEVIMVNAESEFGMPAKGGESSEEPSGSGGTSQDAPMKVDTVGPSEDGDSKLSKPEDHSSSSPCVNNESSTRSLLLSLPQGNLRLLCSMLAREGLSDNAYGLVAEVLKKLVAIAPSYCHLFITELANSMHNLTISAMSELQLYEDAEKALLTTSSTNGTSILRVLQSLSSLVATLHESNDPQRLPEKDHTDALSQVSEINGALESLWIELSNSISKIERSSESTSDFSTMSENSASTSTNAISPLPAGTQNILPYIESFFVICEKLRPEHSEVVQELGTAPTTDIEDNVNLSSGQRSPMVSSKAEEKNVAFVKFSEKHRKLLNAFIRQNPGLLEKSFSLMLKVPRFIDFDNKRAHFRSKIKHQHDHHHSPVRISVRRAYILEDSYNQLRMRSPQDLKGRLTVHFQGEEGIDAGGLTREWYQLLSRVIFDKGALLFTTVGNDSTFQPNPNSVYQTEHLSYFKFVGRVVGKALFDGQLLDVHFTRSFYKHILGAKVTYHDIEAIDPDYYKNLKWMLENDIGDVLDLTFSMDADEEKLILYEREDVTDSELIPGGRNIRVTEENKHEYVDRVVEHRLTTAIRPQINAFMEGFNDMIPRELVSIFNDKELELLISGLPDIDLDDLRANSEYSGYSNASPVIQWFWEVVQGFSKEDKARFLQFVTGTSKVPLEGFSALQGISGSQRFQIHKAYGSSDHLPSAHTCFNQLDLPEYTSKERLQERLLLAIHEANEGFGFG
ncbi:uncharacterized protein A4U43_C02F4420 [Asparagus officinalis]|uniref:HECT-type E3 ubiquitin transferase n=1 Tax=Asparagus officinalis TaxID=4686 RepID=A0A5P1FKW4_ASPOF|nr:uncharacterized protein A4U43_C02F4420 [Asparagus officinalis]